MKRFVLCVFMVFTMFLVNTSHAQCVNGSCKARLFESRPVAKSVVAVGRFVARPFRRLRENRQYRQKQPLRRVGRAIFRPFRRVH